MVDMWKVEILNTLVKHKKKINEAIDFLGAVQKEIRAQFK